MNAPVNAVLKNVFVPVSQVRDPCSFGVSAKADCLHGDLIVENGVAVALRAGTPGSAPRIVIPALTEAHCHLDKCHTIGRLGPVGGNLRDAINRQYQDKSNWTEADLRHRAERGITEAIAAGCSAMRTHVDWGEDTNPPLNWSVLTELARQDSGLTLQCACLTSVTDMADPAYCDAVARAIASDRGVLGAFVLDHKQIAAGVCHMITSAEKYGLALDFHVDEGLGAFNGLEIICDAVLDTGFQGPVLCGHAVSLADRTPDDFARIADKLRQAGITICALPTTNLYLQGRTGGTPDRRGLTRLRELHESGVSIAVASDNVADAFCPLGQHDPMAALHLAALTGHLDPPLDRWLPAVTANPARAMGLTPVCVDGALVRDLRISAASDIAGLVSGRHPLSPLTDTLREIQT